MMVEKKQSVNQKTSNNGSNIKIGLTNNR